MPRREDASVVSTINHQPIHHKKAATPRRLKIMMEVVIFLLRKRVVRDTPTKRSHPSLSSFSPAGKSYSDEK
jgi:hypothetical protein